MTPKIPKRFAFGAPNEPISLFRYAKKHVLGRHVASSVSAIPTYADRYKSPVRPDDTTDPFASNGNWEWHRESVNEIGCNGHLDVVFCH